LTLPTIYTKPLSEDYPTDGTKVRELVERAVKTVNGRPFIKQEWQLDLFDRVLERYREDHPDPDKAGRIRYRQVVISLGRQNGKSVLAALLGLYGLIKHVPGPTIIGLASSREQADIIYAYVKEIIDGSPALRKRYKTTGTRGITRRERVGSYRIKPAKADALQGIPTSMCLFDEVHICDPDMWQAMVKGTTSFDDGIVIGLTTAGDDESVLLDDLYKLGKRAAAGDPELERFGFFCWEAPEGCEIDDPEAIKAANPSVAAGLIPVSRIQDQVRTEPPHMARRFTLNQFVSGSESWLDMHTWLSAATGGLSEGSRPVFVVDRTPGQAHASVVAVSKDGQRYGVELVADLDEPSDTRLLQICQTLYAHNPLTFVMDKYSLGDLAKELERYGYPVKALMQGDVFSATEFAYRQIKIGRVHHDGNPRFAQQIPWAKVKNYGDRWRLVRRGSGDIDAIQAMLFGIYAAETYKEVGIQLF
jgi:phage terminase large subunit-like protein